MIDGENEKDVYYRAQIERGDTGKVEERLADDCGNEATVLKDDNGEIVAVGGDEEPIKHFYPDLDI